MCSRYSHHSHSQLFISRKWNWSKEVWYIIFTSFKWHKSRANFRQRWNFKISPHRRHKSFHCIRWCCVTRYGQIWQWYTQSEQFADKIAIRKNSRFERSFLLACLISPTKRSLPSSRPTPRIYEKKKKKKKTIAESAMQTRTRAYFHVVRGICSIPDARHIFFHLSLSTFEIYFRSIKNREKVDFLKDVHTIRRHGWEPLF